MNGPTDAAVRPFFVVAADTANGKFRNVATIDDFRSDIQAREPCEQANTRGVSIRSIVASREFARGLDEVRSNIPFNADNDDWDYERGRCFGFIAPLDMPLRIGRALNPEAVKLAKIAFSRKLLL